jgi:tetratricopeptide (TPR) repeat protein
MIEASFGRSGVAADLAEVAITDAASVLAMYSGGPEELQAYAAGAFVQTDDRGSLEFSAPRAIVGTRDDNLTALQTLAPPSRLPPIVAAARSPVDAARWRERGRMYLEAEAYNLAYEAFERAVTLDADDQTSLDGLGRAAGGAGRRDAAVTTLHKLVANDGRAIAARVVLSRLLVSIGDAASALEQVTLLVAGHPDDPRPAEQAASIFADIGDAERLRPLAAHIGQRWPDRPSAAYFAGTTAFMEGKPEDAERFARQGIAAHPNEAQLYTLLGASSASLKRAAAARAAFEKALTLSPRDPVSYTNLGLLDLEAGAPQSAIRWFAEALIIDPTSVVAINGLAQALRQTGQYDRAARVEHAAQGMGDPRR